MSDKNGGIFLVLTPNKKGVTEALRMKIGMENLKIPIRGVILDNTSNETIPIHALEAMLHLEVFSYPEKAG